MSHNGLKNYAAITVFGVPPSVNQYKIPIAGMRRTQFGMKPCIIGFRLTKEAISWKNDVAVACNGIRPVTAKLFQVRITVCLGPGQRGDCDNFPKLVLDPIADCGMFQSPKGKKLSDSHVQIVTVQKMRSDEPRTYIIIEPFKALI